MDHHIKIYAKASFVSEEIREKIRCGCDGLEFNLQKDFLRKGSCFETCYLQELFTMHNVEVVHVPFYEEGQVMNMEHVFQHVDTSPIDNVFRLAQYCADIWKHRILVVIHTSLSFFDFMEYELFRSRLERELQRLFEQFPMTDLGIENVIPMEYKNDGKNSPRLCNGTFTDLVQIVGYLRERFGERVGSVLDICHAAMTEKYMKALLAASDFLPHTDLPRHTDYGMEHYFQMHKEVCKLIHFNDFTGNGYMRNHGTPFQDQKKVDALLELYTKYEYGCPLTLEIREDNYRNCRNYRQTKAMLQRWIEPAAAVAES
uniref:Xylose isomerase-like TIM barrel domain-containing protein n=1 Tax=Eubacterium plexicaudatum ASF492 TaxID=1235802 RepID=N2AGD9_9FIRM